MIVLPPEVPEASEIAQRYVVNVAIDQDFYEKPDPVPAIFRDLIVFGNNINSTIEYPDYAVSEAISATIDGWENCLRRKNQSKVLSLIFKHQESLEDVVPRGAAAVLLFSGVWQVSNAESVRDGLLVIMLSIALAYVSQPLTSVGIKAFFAQLAYFKAWTFILVTEGDRRRYQKLNEERGRGLVRPVLAVIGVLSSLALAIIGNYIYDGLR